MKRCYLPFFWLFFVLQVFAQDHNTAFKGGEFLKYKIHYGLVNAGMMTVELEEKLVGQDTLLHSVGKGWTTGHLKYCKWGLLDLNR